ncbi:MAG: type II toxin-antitoxin system PemK/MazF family toxin [Bryobacteraceae bacterium]
MTFPRRGEIYLVEFDPARGHEIQKTRPAGTAEIKKRARPGCRPSGAFISDP